MATLEEKLVAYQVVRSLNMASQATLALAGQMKGVKDDQGAATLKEQGVKTLDSVVKSLSKTDLFIEKYPGGKSALARGYQWLGATPKQVADDLANLVTVGMDTKQALMAGTGNQADVVGVGNAAHNSVQGNVTVIDDETHYGPIQMHVICWDLVNAIAITLQGKSPGHGTAIPNDSVEMRKARVRDHLKTFGRTNKYLDGSREAANFMTAAVIVESGLDAATTLGQLSTLGAAVDAIVPRAPFMRRVWQYD